MTDNPYESPETYGHSPPPAKQRPQFVLRWLLIGGILLVLAALLLPFGRFGVRESARRMQCANHLMQIGIALHNYHDVYGCFPPAYTVDAAGKPLHSWRTLILPYIEQKALYDQIDLTKPWDDPANKTARETRIPPYQCPSSTVLSGQTTYFAVVAPGACFQPSGPTSLSAITDGPSNTLLVIEVADEHAVPWMSPTDASEALILSRSTAKKHAHPKGTQAVFADGRTQFLPAALPPAILRALISIAGNDQADF